MQFKLAMDAIVWGFKHMKRDISEAALELLLELLVGDRGFLSLPVGHAGP